MLLSVINHIRPNVIYCYIWNFSHPSEIFQWSFFMKTVIFPDKLTPSSLSLSLFLFFLMFLSFASVLARIQKCQQCRSLNYSPSPCNFHNSKNMYVQIPNLSIWMNLKLCLKMLFCTEFPASFFYALCWSREGMFLWWITRCVHFTIAVTWIQNTVQSVVHTELMKALITAVQHI